MLMPEATMHEHYPSLAAIGDVGRAGQVAVRNAVPSSERRQHRAHDQFGLGTARANSRHTTRDLGTRAECLAKTIR